MTETTSNHNWTIPTVGGDEDTWGQVLNDFFDNELDRQVILEDTIANRPTADGTTVKYFHATDEGRIYYNDGSTWNLLLEDQADKADNPHNIGGSQHSSDTLSNLNSKVSDATLDDSSDTRPPQDHDNTAHTETYAVDGDAQPPESHASSHESGGTDEIDSGSLAANSEFQIFTTSSEVSNANVGTIWYRTDLD